jgi:hypothetical protein
MHCKLRFTVLALTLVAVWPAMVRATDDRAKGAARELAKEGKRDFDAGRFEEAGDKFQRAYEIAKVPTLAVWAARALVKRGSLVVASELYRQAIQLAPNDLWIGNAQQQAQTDAAKELGELQPRIPRLRVRVEGAAASDVELAVDDVKIASALLGIEMPMDPGRRHIAGKRGAEAVKQTIELGEGEHKQAVLRFTAGRAAHAPASTPSATAAAPVAEGGQNRPLMASTPTLSETQSAAASSGAQRTWGWVAIGVGAAGLLTGAVTGIVLLSDSGLRNSCPNNICDPSKDHSTKIYNILRYASPAGFIVGAVGAAVGIPLLLWTPKPESEPHTGFWLGPGSAGVKGAF